MGRLWWAGLVLAALVAARPAAAGLLVASSGTLQACPTTCSAGCDRVGIASGVGANTTNGCTGAGCSGSCLGTSLGYDWVQPDGATNLTIQPQATGGTSLILILENSIDGGVSWAPVASVTINIGSNNIPAPFVITNPNGRYRTSISSINGNVLYAIKYKAVRRTHQ